MNKKLATYVTAIVLSIVIPSIAHAQAQGWQDDQDGQNFICANVQYFQANNGIGVGDRCARFDSTGKLIPASFDCVDPAAIYYQTVQDPAVGSQPQEPILGFGYDGGTICTTDDPGNTRTNADLCPEGIGAGSCTNCSVSFDGFGREATYSSGPAPVTSIGVTAPITSTGGTTPTIGISLPSGQIAYGTGTNVTSSANLTYDGTTLTSNTPSTTLPAAILENANTVQANPTLAVASSSATGQAVILFDTSGTTSRASFRADYLGDLVFAGVTPATSQIFFFTNGDFGVGNEVMKIFNNGHVQVSTAAVSVDLSDTGNLFSVVGGNIYHSGGRIIEQAQGAPSTPGAGFGIVYFDSTSKNLAVKSDAGTVNHGAQTVASSSHVALTGLADNGSWTTQTFQAPLTACTDYVSVSCQGGTSDIGTGGSNSAVQNIALHDGASARWPTSGTWANAQVIHTLAGAIKAESNILCSESEGPYTGDVAKSAGSCGTAVIGITDGSSNDWTTSGTFVAGQPLVATGGNHITTNAIKNFARTSSIQYNLPDLTSASTNCSIFPGAVPGGTFCNPDGNDTEFSKGFAAGFCRITAYFTSNTWATPTVDFQAQVTRNGSNVTGCITPVKTAGTTGLVDSGEISVASTAATDTWGVHVGSHYASGLASIWINVEIYQ